MSETLYCAMCEGTFEPDDDHVKIQAETVRIDERNENQMFVLHPQCYNELSGEWVPPV
jgi:hypothetical protein